MQKEIEISPDGSMLVYKRGFTREFVERTIKERNLKGLRVFSHLKDEKLEDLSFLREFTFLQTLEISSLGDHEYDFLHSLRNLKDLSLVSTGVKPIDLGGLQGLTSLTIKWRKGRIFGIDQCKKIQWLCLVEFGEVDFTSLSPLPDLKELIVKTSSINSLQGIDRFQKLDHLFLGNCLRLASINPIKDMKGIRILTFKNCKKVGDFGVLGSLSNLERLEITDCRGLNSIGFIQKLHSLKQFLMLGDTVVVDNDLVPALSVPEVFCKHRKGYNVEIMNAKYSETVSSNSDLLRKL